MAMPKFFCLATSSSRMQSDGLVVQLHEQKDWNRVLINLPSTASLLKQTLKDVPLSTAALLARLKLSRGDWQAWNINRRYVQYKCGVGLALKVISGLTLDVAYAQVREIIVATAAEVPSLTSILKAVQNEDSTPGESFDAVDKSICRVFHRFDTVYLSSSLITTFGLWDNLDLVINEQSLAMFLDVLIIEAAVTFTADSRDFEVLRKLRSVLQRLDKDPSIESGPVKLALDQVIEPALERGDAPATLQAALAKHRSAGDVVITSKKRTREQREVHVQLPVKGTGSGSPAPAPADVSDAVVAALQRLGITGQTSPPKVVPAGPPAGAPAPAPAGAPAPAAGSLASQARSAGAGSIKDQAAVFALSLGIDPNNVQAFAAQLVKGKGKGRIVLGCLPLDRIAASDLLPEGITLDQLKPFATRKGLDCVFCLKLRRNPFTRAYASRFAYVDEWKCEPYQTMGKPAPSRPIQPDETLFHSPSYCREAWRYYHQLASKSADLAWVCVPCDADATAALLAQ